MGSTSACALVLLAAATLAPCVGMAQEFSPTATYEEVARVGGPDEPNPLLY